MLAKFHALLDELQIKKYQIDHCDEAVVKKIHENLIAIFRRTSEVYHAAVISGKDPSRGKMGINAEWSYNRNMNFCLSRLTDQMAENWTHMKNENSKFGRSGEATKEELKLQILQDLRESIQLVFSDTP
jgi:hypothetical protein